MEGLAIICVTKKGTQRGLKLKEQLGGDLYTLPKYHLEGSISMDEGFKSQVEKIFNRYSTHLFIMASGIVVRSIAHLLRGKNVDPGILVMDEEGNFVSSLLSGHLGGANEACEMIADATGAVPVISTASDVSGKIAVDTISQKIRGKLESLETAKRVTSLIVAGEEVEIRVPGNIGNQNPSGIVVISNRKNVEMTRIIPRNIVVGIGCRRGTPVEVIERALLGVMDRKNLHMESIRLFATVDLKGDEEGILDLVKEYGRDLIVIERNRIKEIEERFITSEFVRRSIGVGAVSAPAAFLASGREGEFLEEKHCEEGVTISIYQEETR